MVRKTGQFVGVVIAGLVLVAAVGADVTIEMEVETKGPTGTQTVTIKQYYADDKMRSEYGEQSVSIIDLVKERSVTLLPAMKKYLVQTFADMRAMGEMFKDMKVEIAVEKTDETEEISGYPCVKYIVRTTGMGPESVTEYWMTTGVEPDESLKAWVLKAHEVFKEIPHQKAAYKMQKQFADDGLVMIRMVMRMKGPAGPMITTTTVTKIEPGDLDESLFEIPDDYTDQMSGIPGGGGIDLE